MASDCAIGIGEIQISNDDNNGQILGKPTSINELYHDSIWSQNYMTYEPELYEFTRDFGCSISWYYFPTIVTLLGLFWTICILRDIVNETSR